MNEWGNSRMVGQHLPFMTSFFYQRNFYFSYPIWQTQPWVNFYFDCFLWILSDVNLFMMLLVKHSLHWYIPTNCVQQTVRRHISSGFMKFSKVYRITQHTNAITLNIIVVNRWYRWSCNSIHEMITPNARFKMCWISTQSRIVASFEMAKNALWINSSTRFTH